MRTPLFVLNYKRDRTGGYVMMFYRIQLSMYLESGGERRFEICKIRS
jgi:hypothetical protein